MTPELPDKAKAGQLPDVSAWLDAGDFAPSTERYRITWPHDHKTLHIGDMVVMTETPSHENMLLRESDMTLHRLQDASGQYVHMVEASNADLRQDAPSKPKS